MFPAVLVLLIMLLSFQLVLAKVPGKRKFIKLTKTLEPKLDTSYAPSPSRFSLGIKYSRIIYPGDLSALQHGSNLVVDLKAQVKKDILRGRVEEVQHNTVVYTREHGVKPRFSIDLTFLAAKYAPDIARLMDAELEGARRKLASEIEKQEKLMNQELRSANPRLDMPTLPAHAAANQDPKVLSAELAKSKEQEQKEIRIGVRQLKAALAQTQEKGHNMPQLPIAGSIKQPLKQVSRPGMPLPSIPEVDTSLAELQMAAQLARANLVNPVIQAKSNARLPALPVQQVAAVPKIPQSDLSQPEKLMSEALVKARLKPQVQLQVDAELARAKKQTQAAISQAQPAMNAILTQLHTSADLKIPTDGNAEPEPAQETQAGRMIQWDAWHKRFADLAGKPILSNMSKGGNPCGSNTVEITVQRNHHLTVRLRQPGSQAFDQAIVQAYQSLDANAQLEFPSGSRRSAITFLIDNKHTQNGVPSGVKSQTSVGDNEILRR